jgi:hypothetical protein
MTKLWVTINNNGLLTEQLSEYMKLLEIVIVLVFEIVKDDHTFSFLHLSKTNCPINWTIFECNC